MDVDPAHGKAHHTTTKRLSSVGHSSWTDRGMHHKPKPYAHEIAGRWHVRTIARPKLDLELSFLPAGTQVKVVPQTIRSKPIGWHDHTEATTTIHCSRLAQRLPSAAQQGLAGTRRHARSYCECEAKFYASNVPDCFHAILYHHEKKKIRIWHTYPFLLGRN
jgi:hypothetical protein